jgi:hypothetical protein
MFALKKAALATFASFALSITLAGCAEQAPPAMIDSGATLTLDGAPIVRQAPGNGQISVFDVNQQKVVFSGYVKQGDVITLDPSSKRLTIGDDVAADNLGGGDGFQISFDAAQ